MPLTRYLIRNEYGLADPELYSAADKDDPEALLEGVAMAGLVGVLRQLGDLAEFAAEIFHNLHEEVMATAARGHSMMVRVQQLETEFPSIEKAFLSQKNNTSFLFNPGIDWHPNLHSEQNLISRGDLPRFVMDSYEDCRGPPRLFLLDKFDVAGAGACLKRYTDPSFFLVDSPSSNTETQRETKLRKVKKKGSRWKNGETPDIGPASHVNLQQLLMEERIENGYTDPARLVKLKKRQLSNYGADSKTGKNYMEKFLEIPSPEQKMVCGTSVTPPCLELISDGIGESRVNTLEINTVNHIMKSPGRESTSSSCNAREEVLKSLVDDELSCREIVKFIEPIPDNELERRHPMSHGREVENEAVDEEGKPESSVDGYQSDDVISEVDNYMDALNILESELETYSEYKSKDVGKNSSELDVNEEHLGIEAQFLDLSSIGNSSESDEGNISLVLEKSNFSCSSAVMADDKLELFNSNAETQNFNSADIPFNLPPGCTDSQDSIVKELGKSTIADDEKVSNSGVVSSESCFSANPSFPSSNSGSSISMALMVESGLDKTALDHVGYGTKTSETVAELDKFIVASSDITSPTLDDTYQYRTVNSERHPVSECNGGNPNLNSDLLLHSQSALELVGENEPVEKRENNILQVDYQDENSFVDHAPCIKSSSKDKLLSTSVLPEMELSSVDESSESLTILRDFSSDAESNNPTSTVDNSMNETEVKLEELSLVADSPGIKSECKEQFSNTFNDVPRLEAGLVVKDVIYLEEIKEVSRTPDDGNIGNFIHNADWVGSDIHLDELQSLYQIDSSHVHENLDCVVKAEDFCDSAVDITETAVQTVMVELPWTNRDGPCHKDPVDLDNVPTEAFCETVIVPAATIPNTRGFAGVDEDSHISLDLLSSSRITKVMEENQSGVGNHQTNQTKSNEAICGESDVEPEIKRKENQLEDLSDLDADLEGNDSLSVYGFPQTAHSRDTQTVNEACLSPPFLGPTHLELQANSTNLADTEDVTFSPPCCLPILESLEESFVEMQHMQDVAAVYNVEEMPPLPPLPPMQWRLGKIQPSFPAPHRESVETNENQSHSMIPPKMDQTPEEFALHSSREIVHMENPFLFPGSEEHEKLNTIPGDMLHELPISISLQLLTIANHPYNSISLDDKQSLDPFVTIPMAHDEKLEFSSRQEVVQSDLIPSLVSRTENGIMNHGSPSSPTNSLEPPNELLSEPDLTSEMLQHAPQNLGVAEVNHHVRLEAPLIKHEQHQGSLVVEEEGEIASSSTASAIMSNFDEAQQPNGKPPNKIPRPRSPLIDAVAAHDKRLLRKATERILPQVVPKVDERDTMLQQIRTKSFNLKPAVVTRPIIHGPKTNLNVAAILQRANAIRQACAGSDEDEDGDSWSDSD